MENAEKPEVSRQKYTTIIIMHGLILGTNPPRAIVEDYNKTLKKFLF